MHHARKLLCHCWLCNSSKCNGCTSDHCWTRDLRIRDRIYILDKSNLHGGDEYHCQGTWPRSCTTMLMAHLWNCRCVLDRFRIRSIQHSGFMEIPDCLPSCLRNSFPRRNAHPPRYTTLVLCSRSVGGGRLGAISTARFALGAP